MGRLIELVRAYQNASATHTAIRFGEEIIRTVGPLLHRYIQSGCPLDAVEDVLQETYIAIVTSADRFVGEADGQFLAWCYGITRNKIANHYRGEEKLPVLLDLGDIEKILNEGALNTKESEQLRDWHKISVTS